VAARQAEPQSEGQPEAQSEWMHWTDGRYRITPGDVLEFTFPFVPELNQTVTVQPDGYISLKEVDDLRVQGRTVTQVKADALEAYGRFVREPMLNVTRRHDGDAGARHGRRAAPRRAHLARHALPAPAGQHRGRQAHQRRPDVCASGSQ
jgi:hypothetical protein